MAYRVQLIWNTHNTSGVVGVMTDGYARYFAYNFTSLRRHGTIEFRQHKGSVDEEEIMKWVEFCTSLFKFAHDSTDAVVGETVRVHSMEESYGFLDLLSTIGANGLRPYYEGKLRRDWVPGFEPP
jgi:hypothetical protein